jgi:hypothetical protein
MSVKELKEEVQSLLAKIEQLESEIGGEGEESQDPGQQHQGPSDRSYSGLPSGYTVGNLTGQPQGRFEPKE